MLGEMSDSADSVRDADTVRERVRSLLDEKGIRYSEASRRVGKNQTYIQQYLKKGSPEVLPEDVREKLAKVLGIPEGHLRVRAPRHVNVAEEPEPFTTPEPVRRANLSDERFAPREMPRDVPVLGSASCGEDGLFEFNGGSPIEFKPRPPRLVGVMDAYALYVS